VRPVKIAAKPATRVHNFLVKLNDACKYLKGMVAAKLVDYTIFLHFHFFFWSGQDLQ
jgi:hypothetical protein